MKSECIMLRCSLLGLLAGTVLGGPLDDYVSKVEPKYGWRDTGARVTPFLSDTTAHILNVTSLEWLDVSRAIGPNGALWTHQVRRAPHSDRTPARCTSGSHHIWSLALRRWR